MIQKNIASILSKGYFLVDKQECDLNNDSFNDLIVVFGNNKDVIPNDPETKIAPIVVLINQKSNKLYSINEV